MYTYRLIGAEDKDGNKYLLNNRLSFITFCDLQTGGKIALRNIKATLKREAINPKAVTNIIIYSVYCGIIVIPLKDGNYKDGSDYE